MDGYVQIGTKLDTKDFDAEIEYVESQLEEIEHKLKQADMGFEVGDTQKLEAQYSRLVKQLDRLQKKQAELNRTDLSSVQKTIENIGNSTGKTIKKLGKWALGIFAIESAYGFVRQAMSSITQYNEQIGTDVEYIRFSLASMLQPVIETLINLVYKLLTYINYVAQQWFGINLFANASADAFNKADKNAKKLQKTMVGFDEMNVIGSNDANKGNSLLPSTDLTQQQVEIPEWLKKITDALEGLAKFAVQHPELLIGILGGAKLIGFIASIIGVAGGTAGLLGISTALLIINAISIKKLIDEFKEYDKVLKNIVDNTNQSIKNSQKLKKQFEETTNANEQFTKQIEVFIDNTGDASRNSADLIGNLSWWGIRLAILNGNLKDYEEILKNNLQTEKEEIEAFEILYQKTDKTTEQTDRYIDLLTEYRDSLIDVNNELNSNKDATYMMSDTIKANNEEITRINEKIGNLNTNLKNSANNFENVGTEASETKTKLSNAKLIYDSFKSKNVKLTVDAETSKAQSAFKNIFNGISGTVSNIFSSLGLNIKIPKLATGGIINMPGHGVPIGGAIGGEAGAEGVIPLTDSQAMETLGATIGKYITINANITNTMNGRVISRELQKINTNNDFATNR